MEFPSPYHNLLIHLLAITSDYYKFYWVLSILKDIESKSREVLPDS